LTFKKKGGSFKFQLPSTTPQNKKSGFSKRNKKGVRNCSNWKFGIEYSKRGGNGINLTLIFVIIQNKMEKFSIKTTE